MTRLILVFFTFLISLATYSQDISIEEYTLKNGFKVYLNIDESSPFVYGAVVVKGGSKYDPKDATGVAHYMEHLMFKGTEKVGTTDYQNEKPYLDSISILYNKISETSDESQRLAYQLRINKLSQQASKYVIVDEMDNLLEDIGSVDINAYTSEDAIVYHNVFPGNQIEKWITLYSHRFEKPVFRMFQNELEVVYEEKNMTLDDPFNQFYEEYSKRMYKAHPYGQQTILGTIEHLKNPSVSKLYEYVEKYYVPNNMALILCGNFDATSAINSIEQTFGKWKDKNIQKIEKPVEPDISTHEVYEIASTPVRTGAIGFRSVPILNQDEDAITICNYLLENDMGTGFLDELNTYGKILDVSVYQNHYVDYGDITIEFAPNNKTSFSKTEKLIMNAIEKLKNGNFSEEKLEAAKLFLKKEKQNSIEYIYDYLDDGDGYGRLDVITELFLSNNSWENFISSISKIDEIDKEKIISISKKYFTDNHISIYSKKGNQNIQKLEKPPYSPIEINKKNKESYFAKNFRNNVSMNSEVKSIDFNKDISTVQLKENSVLYHTQYELNDIFHLKLNIGIGKREKPELEYLAYYMNSCGTNEFPIDEFYQQLEKQGISIDIECTNHFFEIKLDGFNQNLEFALNAVNGLITDPYIDNNALKKLADVEIYEREYLQEEPYTVSEALTSYALLNENSPYLTRLSSEALRSFNNDDLISLFDIINESECNIHYSGRLSVDTVAKMAKRNIFSNCTKKSNSPISFNRRTVDENIIYLLDMPNAVQSQIYFYVEGEVNSELEEAVGDVFTTYVDKLLYNQIRDFHSLAYTAYYSFENGYRSNEKGYSIAYLSTQSDKTTDALSVLLNSLNNISFDENEISTIANRLLLSSNCKTTTKRNISEFVEWWQKKGLTQDPIILKAKTYKSITNDNIKDFYNKNLANRKHIITIVGDKSKFDLRKLSEFGEIIELTKKDIFK